MDLWRGLLVFLSSSLLPLSIHLSTTKMNREVRLYVFVSSWFAILTRFLHSAPTLLSCEEDLSFFNKHCCGRLQVDFYFMFRGRSLDQSGVNSEKLRVSNFQDKVLSLVYKIGPKQNFSTANMTCDSSEQNFSNQRSWYGVSKIIQDVKGETYQGNY